MRKKKETKEIVLGVTGSIAAYKAPELVRRLKECGFGVSVIMTESACRFITPLTLETVSGRRVEKEMFGGEKSWDIAHVSLAERADVVLVAPATANTIARLAAGIADDLLTAVILATRAPVVVAPAMNTGMWRNPVTEENVRKLRKRGFHIAGPARGKLACGEEGEGRLVDSRVIVEKARKVLAACGREGVTQGKASRGSGTSLAGRRIVVTAGPTREPVDAIRFLTNPASGRMGYALAEAARERQAEVTLVSGPSDLPDPAGVKLVRVETAGEMAEAVMDNLDGADCLIMAAAPANYRPARPYPGKIRKGRKGLILELEETPDILSLVSRKKKRPLLVGFSLEVSGLLSRSREKLREKGLDLIVANKAREKGSGFGTETNRVTIIDRRGKREKLPLLPKPQVAHHILDRVERHLTRRGRGRRKREKTR